MASVLPDDKFCVLDTPNDIAGRSLSCGWVEDFDGSIDSDSVLAFDGTVEFAAVYGGSDVVVPKGRYIVWSDINHGFDGSDFVVFENMMDYLINGCCGTCDATEVCVGNTCVCDTTIECDGLECGTGVCGGACTSTCDATEVCVGNTCCDTTTECDGFECGTGVCGGDCPSSCDATEVCEGNTCVCDTANECNGLECGTGVCGGDCSSSCDSESEVCIVNSCEPFFTASNWSL